MDVYYGRAEWCAINSMWQCAKCDYKADANKGKAMITHIATKHKEYRTTKNIMCPYCPLKFAEQKNLNRHIYENRCPNKTEADGKQIWKDICEKKNKNELTKYPRRNH
eukprot:GEMP01119734.1.p1 GENE.GEMP01119734.1~~GEMP01119734.1.p1  ORF type:complete len:125 (+),score=3.57 GEMP01119734.1:54-377(+)